MSVIESLPQIIDRWRRHVAQTQSSTRTVMGIVHVPVVDLSQAQHDIERAISEAFTAGAVFTQANQITHKVELIPAQRTITVDGRPACPNCLQVMP